jgi:hypothetical protein
MRLMRTNFRLPIFFSPSVSAGQPLANRWQDERKTYQALEIYEIMNVESVFGGLYSAGAPKGNKRRPRR